jgi:hypothetical protein
MGVSRLQVMRRVGDLTKKMKLSVAAFKVNLQEKTGLMAS